MELNAIEVIERIKSHLSSKELEDMGYSTGLVSTWKKRNTLPKSEDLYKISQKIGVSMEYLLTGVKDNPALPPEIQKAIMELKSLTPEQRNPVLAIISSQVEYWKNINFK